jgi:hypothetical protein
VKWKLEYETTDKGTVVTGVVYGTGWSFWDHSKIASATASHSANPVDQADLLRKAEDNVMVTMVMWCHGHIGKEPGS